MSKALRLAAPAGMTGIAVEPWAPGEIYAVAANWADAASPVVVYGHGGWQLNQHGLQVASFRHSPTAALAAEIEEAIVAGGDEADEDEVATIVGDAVDLVDHDVLQMAEMLEDHGPRFTGACADDVAREWLHEDFTATEANEWCSVGCWAPEVAAALRDADLTPAQAVVAVGRLVDAEGDTDDSQYTDGDPMYSACNGDTDVAEIIEAAKEAS